MKKILALDIGDAWTGIAISDALGIIARPYTTVATSHLSQDLSEIIKKENIDTIIVGLPTTMHGKESAQTLKVITFQEKLKETFPEISLILQDERLSSKRAIELRITQGKKAKKPQEKLKDHALAASFILDSYLARVKPIIYDDNEL